MLVFMRVLPSAEGSIYSTRCHGFLFNIPGIVFRLGCVWKEEPEDADGMEENLSD